MTTEQNEMKTFSESPIRISEWRRFRRVFFSRKIVIFGLFILALLVIAAAFAPWLAPYDPYKPNLKAARQQPSAQHILGTDSTGRDTLSRLIYGSRTTLQVGFVTTGFGAIAGMVLGLLAGYSTNKAVNAVIMRLMDLLISFPMIILALFIAAILGGGIWAVIIALGIGGLPGYARVMHGLTLSIKENDYVLAERSMGSSNTRIMFSHILPNALAPMIVLITLQLGGIILAEAGLSYLGIGIKPPGAAWGAMVNDGYRYLTDLPMLSFAPGVAIILVVFAFNLIGDGLRDALDPRLRGMI
jgi:peptide/nickel transport system permease protein